MSEKIKIVDSHQHALLYWAKLRAKSTQAPVLLSLDHHTDTSKPFRNYIGKNKLNEDVARLKLLNSIDFNNSNSVFEAIEKLSNDEHITTAIQTNIISCALIIAHNAYDTDQKTFEEHNIICKGVDRKPNSKKLIKEDYDQVIESDFLKKLIDSFNFELNKNKLPELINTPFILDIDLDYFNTFKSVEPQDSNFIYHLINKSQLVTIAMEPEYVRSCAIEKELTSDYLFSKLEKFFA